MDKLEKYRQCVKKLLQDHSSNDHQIECQLICDIENDHYQIVEMGWQNFTRIYACYIHIDIKDQKIWIQNNMTEIDLGEELVDRGVPASDIVLGFQHPYKRPYTNYGVA